MQSRSTLASQTGNRETQAVCSQEDRRLKRERIRDKRIERERESGLHNEAVVMTAASAEQDSCHTGGRDGTVSSSSRSSGHHDARDESVSEGMC